jgi:hypothetical protein
VLEDPDVVRANMIFSADADFAEYAVEMLQDPKQDPPRILDSTNLKLTTDVVRASLVRGVAQSTLDEEGIARFEEYLHRLSDQGKPPESLAPPMPPGTSGSSEMPFVPTGNVDNGVPGPIR